MDLLWILQDGVQYGLIWAIMGIGVFISYRLLDIADLGAEGTFPLGACVGIIAINSGISPFLALLLALLAGALGGLVTAVLHTLLKIPSLLAGIITMTSLYSINLHILSNRATVSLINSQNTIFKPLNNLFSTNLWGLVITSIIIIVLVFSILYWFFGTEIGIAIRATGKNKTMAKAQGINTNVMIIIGLCLSNALIAMSGCIFAQSQAYSDVNMGRGTIVIGLAAIILGESIFGKRSFFNNLLSIILGSICYFLLQDVALELGLNPNDLKLLQSILIVVFLCAPLFQNIISNKLAHHDKKSKIKFGGGKNASD